MRQLCTRHPWVAATIGAVVVCMLIPLSACQRYARQPFDLTRHRDSLNERGLNNERLEAFRQRLETLGADVPPTFSFADGLTLAEGEVVALFYNADLRMARLDAGVALATYENAGLWEDPEFGFDGAEIWSPSAPFLLGLTVDLTIPVSGRLEVEKSRAGAAYEAELRRIVDAEWRMRGLLRAAWSKWTALQEHAALLRDVVERVDHICALTDQLVAAGELNRVEGRVFQVERAQLRAVVIRVEFETLQSRIELLGLMGLSPNAAIDLAPAFAKSPPADVDDALSRVIAANTELAIRRAEYLVAEESLRLEIRKQYPDITVGAGYGSEDNDDRLLLGFAVPIPILNANQSGIAEARAERDVARAAAEATFERLAQRHAMLSLELESTRTQRAQYEASVIPMLAEQSAEIERIAELGEVDTLLLLDMVTRQLEAKTHLIELKRAEVDASIALRQLLGPETADVSAPIGEDDAARMIIPDPNATRDVAGVSR